MLKIGTLSLQSGGILAPMAGVTDDVFRRLCREQGCTFCYTEMVSAKGLCKGGEKTWELLKVPSDDRPLGVQIFGRDPFIMAQAAEKLCETRWFDLIDINMGCPTPKITKNGEGSALMQEPHLAEAIVRSVVKASSLPITVKIRKGGEEGQDPLPFAKRMQEAGAAAVTLHGRTREQQYSGKADWEQVKRLKEVLSIPVIGNGDITTADEAAQRLTETKCDGVMIGRGAMGNPFIFRQIKEILAGLTVTPISLSLRKQTAIRHAYLLLEALPERVAVREMRKHVEWYFKGFKGAAAVRRLVNQAESAEILLKILSEIEV